jgi:hypothetical protein
MRSLWTRSRAGRLPLAVAATAFGVLIAAVLASAASLPGSNFEIDTDANLKVDGTTPPALDWANVSEIRKQDTDSGPTDESFGQGTKEDTAIPTVVDGSIPPNKSDLLNFGVHLEGSGTDQTMSLFWHRVQEPQGTTNMDFEFNKSSTPSANGVTPVRTAGDLLIQYDLSQGGTNPQLFVSRWVTSGSASQCEAANKVPCWSTKQNLSAAGDAIGSINTSTIPATESDGLGEVSPRTFGEASLDFDKLAGGSGCVPFGSAYLKSRSSDSFTSALKDFIPPTGLSFSNCGAIKISKVGKDKSQGSGNQPLSGAHFQICTNNGPYNAGNPCTPATGGGDLVTGTDGTVCLDNLTIGTTYFVSEKTAPDGYQKDPDIESVLVDNGATCSATPYVGEARTFENIPLTDLTVKADSQSNGQGTPASGATQSSIACKPGEPTTGFPGTDIFDSPSPTSGTEDPAELTATGTNGLAPGVYTCRVFIDP